MDINQTEEQQVEAIKQFWTDNGNAIIAGLVIGLGAFIGFNMYKENKLEKELLASESYLTMLESVEKDDSTLATQAKAFIADNTDSGYAMFTALMLAKNASEEGKWEQAETHLTQAITLSVDKNIKAIATLRLARVQIQLEKYDQALKMLSTELPEAYSANVEEIKGDIYLKQSKNELARNAYQAAIDGAGEGGNSALQMKLDDLAQVVNL